MTLFLNNCLKKLQFLLAEMKYQQISIHTNVRVSSFENHVVTYEDAEGEQRIPADTVIVSVGYVSTNPFADTLTGEKIHTIGDAEHVANLMGAIWKACETAKDI